MQSVYMEVTQDKYELPVAVADNVPELARLVGRSRDTIYSAMSIAKRKGRKCKYVKVEFE